MASPDERMPDGGAERPERVAVIDIGSNSIRLVVYDGLKRAPLPVFNEKVLCGLGRGVEKTGCLNPDGVRAALDNLGRFRRLAEGMQAARLDVLATAAVRDASDGPAFVAAMRERAGLDVQVISGEDEARLSAMGVLSGTPGADGLVGDLGGGSLELVGLDRGVIGRQVTLPIGPLRLLEAGGARPATLVRLIDQRLEPLDWMAEARGRVFYPVGGSWRALAKLHMEHIHYPLHIIHHYTVAATELREFAELVARQSRSSLEKMVTGSRRRLDTLAPAAMVMERVLRAAAPAKVVFSAFGLREGHLFSLLGAEQRRLDPLLTSCVDWSQRFGRFGDAEMLVSWTGGLFAGEDDRAFRLRRAACYLSDLAWADHPDYRAEHAYLRILRFPFPGVDHGERAFLALAGYVRYGGRVDDVVAVTARSLAGDSPAQKATVLGLALRLAQTLAGGAAALLQSTSLRLVDDRLVLTLHDEAGAGLAGEAVDRRLDALARALERRGEVVIAPR
jgi:exopolyphosphatase/guanosine-5'-triphosphate,3'-diphosphate pyrophosphatase